ncbi:MAG: putative DNA binding domain-containing protein [Olegusella sp.]|nr:putative DNA binding domain-containing protein [Olegusella sp.]
MNQADFESLLERGEGTSIEFKRCGNVPEHDTFETICSFANRQGGDILLGVLNDGTVVGVNESAALDIQRNIVNRVNDPQAFNAPPLLEIEPVHYEGMTVIRVWVPIDAIVHKYKGIVYDRIVDSDVKVETDTQLSAMYIRKQEYYSERKVYRYLTKDDLRLDLLPRIREMAVAKKANHPWGSMGDDDLLRSANLFLKDYETGQEGFTLGAALVLGKDEVIASIAPAYKTDAYVQRDDRDRYDDRIVVKTNLIEAYDQLLAFAQKHLPDKFFLEGTQAISLRDVICRELIVNTLIHREYTSPFPAKMVINAEGIRTENASRPRFIGQLTPERFNPLPKNPIIADLFTNIGRADTLGSGTRNLFKYSWAYGGAQPVLSEGDVFEATIPILKGAASAMGASFDVDEVIFRMVTDYGYATVAGVAAIADVTERTVRRHISPLVADGRIIAMGTTRDRRYTLPTDSGE